MKGKTYIKCLSMESGHQKPPEQLQFLPSLWNSIGGMNTLPPKDISSFIYAPFLHSGPKLHWCSIGVFL